MSTTATKSPALAMEHSGKPVAQPQSDLCFIETQFPVSKMSKESYTERSANNGQTLTGLGKWWGRKPLVLCRATILGLLLPATDNPAKDREVFLRLMTMDDDGMLRRKSVNLPAKELFRRLPPAERICYFEPSSTEEKAKLKRGLLAEEKQSLQKRIFQSLSYDERLVYCDRPEQVDGPSPESWVVINAHLGTNAQSLPALVAELGKRRFGHLPSIGDSFCGGGSIPFEAARLGCNTNASDLNPVATLMTWGALNIIGGNRKVMEEVQAAQREVYEAVDHQLSEWGLEHNELGWRADAYLYCVETRDPESDSGWWIPLAPSWVLGEKTHTIARLVPNNKARRYDIEIASGVSEDDMEKAKAAGTVANYRLVPPGGGPSTPIESLIRHLRKWQSDDILPRPDDIFQERLFCIRWVEIFYEQEVGEKSIELTKTVAEALPNFDELIESGELKRKRRRHYHAVTPGDIEREQKVLKLIRARFADWQEKGFIPSRPVEKGTQPSHSGQSLAIFLRFSR